MSTIKCRFIGDKLTLEFTGLRRLQRVASAQYMTVQEYLEAHSPSAITAMADFIRQASRATDEELANDALTAIDKRLGCEAGHRFIQSIEAKAQSLGASGGLGESVASALRRAAKLALDGEYDSARRSARRCARLWDKHDVEIESRYRAKLPAHAKAEAMRRSGKITIMALAAFARLKREREGRRRSA